MLPQFLFLFKYFCITLPKKRIESLPQTLIFEPLSLLNLMVQTFDIFFLKYINTLPVTPFKVYLWLSRLNESPVCSAWLCSWLVTLTVSLLRSCSLLRSSVSARLGKGLVSLVLDTLLLRRTSSLDPSLRLRRLSPGKVPGRPARPGIDCDRAMFKDARLRFRAWRRFSLLSTPWSALRSRQLPRREDDDARETETCSKNVTSWLVAIS